MNDRKIAVTALTGLVLLAGFVFLHPSKTVVERVENTSNTPTQFGSVASPDVQSTYLSVNGVRNEYRGSTMIQATSSVCSLQSPAATSTLILATVDFTNISTTSTSVFEWGTSSNPTATTTRIGSVIPLASGSQAEIVASSTDTSFNRPLLAPNTYVVGKLGGSTGNDATHPQLYSPSGTCTATFGVVTY